LVTIIGNVKPEDDYTHPLGGEENFNESVYFNFFDRTGTNLGGFIRMGNRANEGHAEMTVIVYQPDGSALFNYKRPQISSNDGWDAGGARVEVLVPGEKIRTTYDGDVVFLKDPRDMRDPSSAFKENPHKHLKLDLIHEGVGPIYGHVGDPNDGNQFARAHYEQHMRVTGTIQVDGEPVLELKGNGLRDHSWGPRYWQSTPSYRWITGNYGDDLGMVINISRGRGGGVFHKGPDELVRIESVDIDTEYEGETNYHKALKAKLKLANGEEHILEGEVTGFIPLRNRRSGMLTHIGEGMTRYTLDGKTVGFGLSEYLDNPE
jgi:hypothetical protein